MFSETNGTSLGQITNEIHAARIYDKRAIQANGIKAKTNFNYTKRQLVRMLQDEEDVRESEIDESSTNQMLH